jgi:hypothetical protein
MAHAGCLMDANTTRDLFYSSKTALPLRLKVAQSEATSVEQEICLEVIVSGHRNSSGNFPLYLWIPFMRLKQSA